MIENFIVRSYTVCINELTDYRPPSYALSCKLKTEKWQIVIANCISRSHAVCINEHTNYIPLSYLNILILFILLLLIIAFSGCSCRSRVLSLVGELDSSEQSDRLKLSELLKLRSAEATIGSHKGHRHWHGVLPLWKSTYWAGVTPPHLMWIQLSHLSHPRALWFEARAQQTSSTWFSNEKILIYQHWY